MIVRNTFVLALSCVSFALGCGGDSTPDAATPTDTALVDQGVDTPTTDAPTTDASRDATLDAQSDAMIDATLDAQSDAMIDATLDAQADATTDAPADAPMDALADLATDVVIAPDATDASALDVTDSAADARDVGFSDLPPADVAPDVAPDVADVPAVDVSDAGSCVPRAPATASLQLMQGGFGPVLTLDAMGFAVLTSRARSTDPGVLYFGRYNADGTSRGSAVVSPVADMGRLGGVVWDGSRYQFTYFRSSDRAIVLGALTSTGSLESSPFVVSAGSVADPERAPMSVNALTGERCVLWRARAIGSAPPVLHATVIDSDDFSTDTALDGAPADGYEVLGISHPTYHCLFVWSAGGAIRALGLPGGTTTTLVPAVASTTRTMTTVAAVATPDRYVVAWNQQGDTPGLHTVAIDGLVRTLGAERRVETLSASATVRRLAVLSATTGYELVTERTDGDTFVQRMAYADDGTASGAPVRAVNVCMPADVIAERLPVATQGTRRYGAFLDLRSSNTTVATY